MQRVVVFLGWAIAIACAICAAAFFIALFVIACKLVPVGHEGDLGTWAGAVFAGLAFAGTIWIATAQRRKIDREAKALAVITLFSMQFRLTALRRQIEKIAVALDAWRPGNPRVDCAAAASVITEYLFLRVEEIEKVLPLDEDVARRMVAATDYVAYCVPLLSTAISNRKLQSDEMFERFCDEMSHLLANAAMHFRDAAVLSARCAGRTETPFKENGIRKIATKKLRPPVF